MKPFLTVYVVDENNEFDYTDTGFVPSKFLFAAKCVCKDCLPYLIYPIWGFF